uniref:Ionotropic glutamate receptor C-terminal domain-containing protein n=1 Tax=Anopheles melas TaxID=34690 RepID=A0A182UB69_9DIPT
MLIFTPHTQSGPSRPGGDRVDHHRQWIASHETRVEFWTQLIAYMDCSHVVLLDSFEFFANRPTFARQLFARLTDAGIRVSVQRRLREVRRLPPVTHRLAIIVPIVMNPSSPFNAELDTFIGQIAQESNFVEFYRWLFVFRASHKTSVWRALQQLPIRADSHAYAVIVAPSAKTVPFHDRIHLERKMMPLERFVRRMQMLPPHHPEAATRTSAILTLPGQTTAAGWVAVWQLYRLHTRMKTIDVAIELLETSAEGRMILYRGLAPEQRNDFLGQATVTTMVHRSAPHHINSTYVAQTIPMFHNARIRTYRIGSGRHKVDLHFQLITTNRFNQRLQGWYSYSLPLFHEHLTMYIHYTQLSYNEQSSQILSIVLLPLAPLGLLLCFSLLLALRTGYSYSRDCNQSRPVSFIDTLIWMVGVLAQQGSIIRPNSSSSMVIILVALYMSAIIYCSYLTKIASLLSVDASVDLDLQTVLSAGQYQIGFVGNSTADETVIQ